IFTEKKMQKKVINITVILLWGILAYLLSVLFNRYVIVKMVLIIMLNMVILWILYRDTIKKNIFVSLFYQALCTISDYSSIVLLGKLVQNAGIDRMGEGHFELLAGIFSQMMVLMLLFFMKKRNLSLKGEIMTEHQWMKLFIVPVFSLLGICAMYSYFGGDMEREQQNTILFIAFGLVFMNLYLFSLICEIAAGKEMMKKSALLAERNRQSYKRFEEIKERYERIRKKEHEFENQMMAVFALAEKQDYEGIKKLSDKYIHSGYALEYGFDTNHPVVNVIFNERYYSALDRGMLIVYKFNDLSKLPLDEAEVSIVLSNLLDNAMEACEKCETDKIIYVNFFVKEYDVLLKVENPFVNEMRKENGRLLSTKQDDIPHGFGIENVREIVERHDGIYSVKYADHIFKVIIDIPLI
ncbi:MAG: GHKL domain-containing protein, partial [Lachnospiraceae bacterium]|nr:GHKL domain-containing protein [Lachnospiraceae bacterium]